MNEAMELAQAAQVMHWLANPWIWVVIGVALIVAEFATGTGHVLGAGLAGLACACLLARQTGGPLASLVWTVPCIVAMGVAIVLALRRDPTGAAIAVGLSVTIAIVALAVAQDIENVGWLIVWAALSLPSAGLTARVVRSTDEGSNLNRYPRRSARKRASTAAQKGEATED